MTPARAALMFRLRKDRDLWHDWATQDEATTPTRYMAQARRDLLDTLLQTLPADLDAIEEDAVAEERGTAEWLEAGAGIGEAA